MPGWLAEAAELGLGRGAAVAEVLHVSPASRVFSDVTAFLGFSEVFIPAVGDAVGIQEPRDRFVFGEGLSAALEWGRY